MDVWETLGYANDYVSSVLGVPAGTPTSDQSYRDAQQALKSSSSSSKGSGSSSSGKGSSSSSSSSSSSGSSEPDVGSGLSVTEQLFREMYNSGYPSTYLVEQGYSDAKRKELMEEYLKWHENGGATPDFTKVSAGSVLDLGYGPAVGGEPAEAVRGRPDRLQVFGRRLHGLQGKTEYSGLTARAAGRGAFPAPFS